ncbi:NAD(P)-dependent oxidoreductase [Actinotalea sp.]|uniref:NAD(P)-dependent oxidoreductase n=1 Tax=Actinotalea sp. TaxID=1872145 RepID=UPI00356597C4
MADVGFIGLGVMGGPMARHISASLAGTGRSLVVNTLEERSAAELVAGGAVWADSPRAVAERCDLVLVMVPDVPAVRALVEGESGLVAGVTGPLTLVICSTVSPQSVRDLDEELAAASGGRIRVVDAPVSGGQRGAEAGTLSIMVGGDDELVAPVLPVLAAAGRPEHLGPLGAGQVAKACNQLICAASLAAIAEASVVAERAGLDVGRLFSLLQGGYAGSTILADKAERYALKDYSVSGAARFWIKDLAAYQDEAERTGTATLMADRLHAAFADLTDAGLGDLDTTVIQAWIADEGASLAAE